MTSEPQNKHGQRTQLAATRLRQMIVAGELAPGQRISERAIGEKIVGLSRTPLREALKILAAEGLVTIAPNRGAVVTALSLAEVEDTIAVINGLEALAAPAACERITPAQLDAIADVHRRMCAAHRERQLMRYFELNQEIHQGIVDAAQNATLSRIYKSECARVRRYRYAGNQCEERWARAIIEHEQIIAFLHQRSGALLREMLRSHHENGWRVARGLIAGELAAVP